MRRRLRVLMVILMIMSLLSGCKNEKGLTVGRKIQDFEYMYKIIDENYPLLEVNRIENNIDWLDKKDEFIDRITETKSDEEYFKVLDEVLREINNGNTRMMNSDIYNSWVKYLKDTEYKPGLIIYDELMKETSVERYKKMTEDNKEKELEEKVETDNTQNNLSEREVTSEILEQDKVAYLEINSLGTRIYPETKTFIEDFYQEIIDYDTLIIDIRGINGAQKYIWTDLLVPILIKEEMIANKYEFFRGGEFILPSIRANETFGSQVKDINRLERDKVPNIPDYIFRDFKYFKSEELVVKPKEEIGFDGKIFLLVDRDVRSTANEFAWFAKDTGFATIIGENTGGGARSPQFAVCSLPYSGYVFTFAMSMKCSTDGSYYNKFTVEPDIEFDATKAEDLNDDKLVQKVLQIVNRD